MKELYKKDETFVVRPWKMYVTSFFLLITTFIGLFAYKAIKSNEYNESAVEVAITLTAIVMILTVLGMLISKDYSIKIDSFGIQYSKTLKKSQYISFAEIKDVQIVYDYVKAGHIERPGCFLKIESQRYNNDLKFEITTLTKNQQSNLMQVISSKSSYAKVNEEAMDIRNNDFTNHNKKLAAMSATVAATLILYIIVKLLLKYLIKGQIF